MPTIKMHYSEQQRSLAELMLAVAGESVTVLKKNAPEQALKLKRQDEWKLYLEFLKLTFNLTDRLSAFHIPIKDQPEFMSGLEDAVTTQLRAILEPAFGSGVDQNDIMMTISGVVAESRKLYEGYRFSITEESKTRNEMFDAFGGRVADALGVADNPQITSAAILICRALRIDCFWLTTRSLRCNCSHIASTPHGENQLLRSLAAQAKRLRKN